MKNIRYKLTFIFTSILIALLAIIFSKSSSSTSRYHQHIEDRKYEPLEESENKVFSTHLPLMEVITDEPVPDAYYMNEEDIKQRNYDVVSATINYYDSKTNYNSLGDIPTITERSLFRVRGRSSRSFDKKGYQVKFKEDNLIDNKKVELSGMTSGKEWALHGPYLDKTLIRNYLCYNIAGDIMDYSPNVRFCEVIINRDYQGLYLLTEKIEYNSEGRINITKSNPKMESTSYIVRLDSGSTDPFYDIQSFNYYTGKNGPKSMSSGRLEIVYPRRTLTNIQKEYIVDDISKFEKTLVSFDSANRKIGYPSFIDVDSFIDYLIINEFTMNIDAGSLSTYFYKDIRGKMKTVVWDFNSAFNNYRPDLSNPYHLVLPYKVWYGYFFRDNHFMKKVERRYKELRKTYLSDDYLLNYVDETIAYLGPAINRNNDIWGYNYTKEYDYLLPEERNPRSYEEAVAQLKDIIVNRGAYMDENLKTLYSVSHDSVNKIFRERDGEAK